MQRIAFLRWRNHTWFIDYGVVFLAVIAAVLYNAWPLGYILDPTVERHALASELQAPNHPYNWLFILTDVVAGLLVAGIGVYQLQRFHFRHGRVVAASIIVFGVLVAVAAVTPLRCDPVATSCGSLWHSPQILLHGFASIGSALMLFVALVMCCLSAYQQHATSLLARCINGLFICWLVFVLASFVAFALHVRGNVLQDYFMAVCGLTMAVVIISNDFALRRLATQRATMR